MKRVIAPLLLISLNAKSQFKIGGELGIACEKSWNGKIKTEVWQPTTIYFAMPIQFQTGKFITNIQPMYPLNLSVGFGAKLDALEAVAGASTSGSLYFSLRVQPKDFFVHISQIGKATLFGIGGKGDITR